jgi:hypothetical protein
MVQRRRTRASTRHHPLADYGKNVNPSANTRESLIESFETGGGNTIAGVSIFLRGTCGGDDGHCRLEFGPIGERDDHGPLTQSTTLYGMEHLHFVYNNKAGDASPGSHASGGPGKTAAQGVAVLDAESSAEIYLAPEPGPWAALKAGRYEVRACLTSSGEWKGTACSLAAQLTVVESAALLTAEQRDAADQHAARTALLAQDWAELDRRGRVLLARDNFSGHMALGDACFGQQKWDQALAHYTAARSAWSRKDHEVPRSLNNRISQLLEILGADE